MEKSENIKKTLTLIGKWQEQDIATSGNYFFFRHPDELYEIVMDHYSDYLEEGNWEESFL